MRVIVLHLHLLELILDCPDCLRLLRLMTPMAHRCALAA